jgi:hypothetical protein
MIISSLSASMLRSNNAEGYSWDPLLLVREGDGYFDSLAPKFTQEEKTQFEELVEAGKEKCWEFGNEDIFRKGLTKEVKRSGLLELRE